MIKKRYLAIILAGLFIVTTGFPQVYNPATTFTIRQLKDDFINLRKLIEDNHPALYRYYDELFFKNFIDSIGSLINRPMTELEFIKILEPMIAKVHCGHTELWFSEAYEDYVYGKNLFIPFSVYYIQDKAFIRRQYTEENLPLVGSEIIKINGDPVQHILKILYSGMNGDGFNRQNILFTINNFPVSTFSKYFDYPESYEIKLIKAGETTESLIHLKALKYQDLVDIANKRYLQEDSDDSDFEFKILDSLNTAVITIGSFVKSQNDGYYEFLKSSFEQIESRNICNLIIDVRGNDGGDPDYSRELLKYIIDKDFVYFKTQMNSPEWNNPIQPYENRFKGNIYTLINGGELSTTGHFISLLKYHNTCKFVGQESGSTYSCNDNSLHFVLPNTKIRGKVARTTFETAVEGLNRNRGIMPDYYVAPDINDVIKGKDPGI